MADPALAPDALESLACTSQPTQRSPPFSVLVAEIGSAHRTAHGFETYITAHQIHREPDSAYPGTDKNGFGVRPLLWAAADSVVLVGSEGSGYTHVRAVDPNGDVASGTNSSHNLTPMDCEAQDWTISTDREYLFYASNCDHMEALGVGRISVRSKTRSPVFPGTLTHIAGLSGEENGGQGMAPLRGGGVAFFAASFNASAGVWIQSKANNAPQLLTRSDQPAAVGAFRAPRLVTFPSRDGLVTISAWLFEARGAARGSPAVIYTHGGAMRKAYVAIDFALEYATWYAMNQYLSQVGGVNVLSVNYRGRCT